MGPLTRLEIEARAAAAELVRDAMSRQRLDTNVELASAAGITSDTVGDFLLGRRWPILRNLSAMERALNLEAGSIRRMHDGVLSGVGDTVTKSHISVTDSEVGGGSGEGVVTVKIAALGVEIESTFTGPEDRARAIAEIMHVIGLEGVTRSEGLSVPNGGD